MQKTIAKINLKAIKNNAEAFKTLTGKKLCAVVKANAYGHGALATVNALESVADFFAVALIEEALEIRQAVCDKEILVLTPPTDISEVVYLFDERFIASVGDLKTAKLIQRVAFLRKKKIKVHLKINTGMNRYGASLFELGKICKFLSQSEYVLVTGAYSHLYGSDEKTAREQRAIFLRAKKICERYYQNLTFHLSATYGCLLGKKFYFDAVRIGLGLYGYLPRGLTGEVSSRANHLQLQKAMKVYAKIMSSKRYAFGGLGYGKDFTGEVEKGKELYLLRVGYADGFLRKKENGTLDAKENTSPLCMDACLRFGRKQRGRYVCILADAEKTAKETGTIVYEVLCKATARANFEFLYE